MSITTGDLLKILALIVALLGYTGAVRRKMIEVGDHLDDIWMITIGEIPLICSWTCFAISIVIKINSSSSPLSDVLNVRGAVLLFAGVIVLLILHILEWITTLSKVSLGKGFLMLVILGACIAITLFLK